MTDTYGRRLRDLRRAAGLTVEQLAVACGATVSSVYNWESESECPAPLQRYRRMAEALGVSLDDLANLLPDHEEAAA